MRHATLALAGLTLYTLSTEAGCARAAQAGHAQGAGTAVVQAPDPSRASDLSPSEVQQNLAAPPAGSVTQTLKGPAVQTGTQNQTVSRTAVHGGVKVTTTVTTTITTTVPAARSAPPGPAPTAAPQTSPAPAASVVPPATDAARQVRPRHVAGRARTPRGESGHFTARRAGDGWKIARAGSGTVVEANLDLGRLKLAPVIAAAAAQGTVTLFVDGKLVAHGTGKPTLVATSLEGSVPNDR